MDGQTENASVDAKAETHKKTEWIGEQLRSIYDETLSEPIPERFTELLRQLDDKKSPKK